MLVLGARGRGDAGSVAHGDADTGAGNGDGVEMAAVLEELKKVRGV